MRDRCTTSTRPTGPTTSKATTPLSQRAEHGFTLIEVVIALALISIGVASTLRIFGASGRTTVRAEQSEVSIQKAQAELDRLKTVSYGALAMTSQPPSSTDPKDPGNRVEGTTLRVRSDLAEPLVMTPAAGQAAAVQPGPQAFTVGLSQTPITGRIYRYVSWRDEVCPFSLCDGTQNTKRLTVAVVADPTGGSTQRAPVWVSTVVVDPDAAPPGTQAPPGGGPGAGDPVTAQTFYLYDTPCGESQRQTQTGSHPTRDTASSGSSAADTSTCENPDPGKEPDLMGATASPGESEAPLYQYSSDLSGAYPGGLAMRHGGTTCQTSYPAADASNPDATGKWSVHAWSTGKLPQLFHLSRLVTLSLFSVSLGGTQGPGRLCATLVDRRVTDGVPTDRALGSSVYDLSSWPVTVRRLTFSFNLPQAEDIAQDHRLVLVLQLRAESGNDVALVYDHPLYPSLLEVATTTPL